MRNAEQDRVARLSRLGVDRRPQMGAVQPRSPVGVPAMHKGGLKCSGPVHAAGHQRSDVVHPLRAAGPDNRESSARGMADGRADLRRTHQYWRVLQSLFG